MASWRWSEHADQNVELSTTRAQFHGSLYRRILRLRSRFPAYVQAPNFCASFVSVECLVTRSTHVQKPKFVANPWNMLASSTEFPVSVSADSVLKVSRAMKLGPVLFRTNTIQNRFTNGDIAKKPHLIILPPCKVSNPTCLSVILLHIFMFELLIFPLQRMYHSLTSVTNHRRSVLKLMGL